MVSKDSLKKAGLQIGLTFLFTVIYGIGALLVSPLISIILGGTTGIWIGNALLITLLGYGYVKVLRNQSLRQKILAAILGTIVVSLFSSIYKIYVIGRKDLYETVSAPPNLPPSSGTGNFQSFDPVDPLVIFTTQMIFFNLPFIYSIKKNKQLPELDSRDMLLAAGYLIPLAIYYLLPMAFGAR